MSESCSAHQKLQECPLMSNETGNENGKNKRQVILTVLATFVVMISIQIIFFRGDYIWWIPYQLLSPLPWDMMSLLTYGTIGSVLYYFGFYLALYKGMKAIGFSYRDYQAIKGLIWILLMYVTYQAQLFIVQRINELWSLYWNGIRFIVFLWPSLAVTFLVLLVFILIKSIPRSKSNSGHIFS